MHQEVKIVNESLNKECIYTLIGRFKDNTFIDLDGNNYYCRTYRIIRDAIEDGQVYAVNIVWKEVFKDWIIFQYCLVKDFQDSLGSE